MTSELQTRVGNELKLVGLAIAIILICGLSSGLIAGALTANRRHPHVERVFVFVTGLLGSVPGYVMATLLALVFAVTLKRFPVAGNTPASAVVLPALAIAMPQTALLARVVRVETLNVLGQNYVRGARAKRLSTLAIYRRYVLPNVLTAALTRRGRYSRRRSAARSSSRACSPGTGSGCCSPSPFCGSTTRSSRAPRCCSR